MKRSQGKACTRCVFFVATCLMRVLFDKEKLSQLTLALILTSRENENQKKSRESLHTLRSLVATCLMQILFDKEKFSQVTLALILTSRENENQKKSRKSLHALRSLVATCLRRVVFGCRKWWQLNLALNLTSVKMGIKRSQGKACKESLHTHAFSRGNLSYKSSFR